MLSLILAAVVATTPVTPAPINLPDQKTAELKLCDMAFLSDMASEEPSKHILLNDVTKHMPADMAAKISNDCDMFTNGAAFEILYQIGQQQQANADDVGTLPTSTTASLFRNR